MEEIPEKRGPIEKGKLGWPINPFGVVALLVFAAVTVFFIIRPLASQKPKEREFAGAEITTPRAGEIIKGNFLVIELSAKESDQVAKVQFWAKSYVDNKWKMLGEDEVAPYQIEWTIPESFRNKAIVVTTHVYQKDGQVINDPGGWREGIIILSQ